jgi:hypothetical protein
LGRWLRVSALVEIAALLLRCSVLSIPFHKSGEIERCACPSIVWLVIDYDD